MTLAFYTKFYADSGIEMQMEDLESKFEFSEKCPYLLVWYWNTSLVTNAVLMNTNDIFLLLGLFTGSICSCRPSFTNR